VKRDLMICLFLCWYMQLFAKEEEGSQNKEYKQENVLQYESSPYLLQHKDNPVWWQVWGNKAFALAKKFDKPIFLSIGYATCHWCHVMEGDSFEKKEVAEVLNKNFVSIKVDRQQSPQVDRIYMDAAHAMGRSGGWPLTIVMTPEGKPFFSGTFIPKAKLLTILNTVSQKWQTKDKKKIDELAQQVTKTIEQRNSLQNTKKQEVTDKPLKKIFSYMLSAFDMEKAGFGSAPKFPQEMYLLLLMRLYKREGRRDALNMVTRTLDALARGGIRDHLGGGFHRYATDRNFLVPHFEKMLYTNALLLMAYTEAYQLTGNKEYKKIAIEIISYVVRDLKSKGGAFFSAEDADSEKTEGKFYVWSWEELKKTLSGREFSLLQKYYHFSKEGNFSTKQFSSIEKAAGLHGIESANIFYLKGNQSITETEVITGIKHKLFLERQKRTRPLLDKQIITAWNGLLLGALAKAARVFDDEKIKQLAINSAQALVKHYIEGKELKRIIATKTTVSAGLSDYAFLIFGLIELYQSSFEQKWYKLAMSLQEQQNKKFWDKNNNLFFDTEGKDSSLIVRMHSIHDSALPSGNSMSCLNLLRLSELAYKDEYRIKANKILLSVFTQMQYNLTRFVFMLTALDHFLSRSKQVAIIGNVADRGLLVKTRQFNKLFLPNVVFAAGVFSKAKNYIPLLENKTRINSQEGSIYVCENKTCKLPTNDVKKAMEYILNQ
jgi:uncharacterized protein